MSSSVSAGYPLYVAGNVPMSRFRQVGTGAAVIDNGTSATAVNPMTGVYPGLAANMSVTAGSGMNVLVAAGYACVPPVSPQGGAYRFALMTQATLSVASNPSGSTRLDYVVAGVNDNGDTTTNSYVEYLTGSTSPPAVPSSAVVLAEVAVPVGVSQITSGMITDLRTFTCAPGGIAHLPAASAAVAAPESQFFYEADTGRLVQGSGTAGHVSAWTAAGTSVFAYRQAGFPSLTFTADGSTDFEIYYEREPVEGTGFFGEVQSYVQLLIDGSVVDTCYLLDQNIIEGRCSCTFYTSSGHGTRPGAGTHRASLYGSANDVYHTLRVTPVVQ